MKLEYNYKQQCKNGVEEMAGRTKTRKQSLNYSSLSPSRLCSFRY